MELQALWKFYDALVAKMEGERPCVFAKVEALQVPVEDAHREEWERKTRITEIKDLQEQVRAAEWRLVQRQESLVRQAQDNDTLRAQAPCWEADLEQVRTMAQPRVEAVQYVPGSAPQRIGSFARCTDVAQRNQTRSTGSSAAISAHRAPSAVRKGSTVAVECFPNDQETITRRYLQGLQERVTRERQSHEEAQKVLRELHYVEEEEAQLLSNALRESLTRVRRNRERLREDTDEVMRWHLRLQAEHSDLEASFASEVKQLRECSEILSRRTRELAVQRESDCCKAVESARRRETLYAQSNIVGALHARQDSSAMRDQIDAFEQRSAKRTRALGDQLNALHARYENIKQNRSAEMATISDAVAGLLRAVEQCELLAARCVTAGFAAHGKGVASSTSTKLGPGGGGGASPSPHRGCCTPASPLDALALRPAVARIRSALEQCEASVREEHRLSQEEASKHGNSSSIARYIPTELVAAKESSEVRPATSRPASAEEGGAEGGVALESASTKMQ